MNLPNAKEALSRSINAKSNKIKDQLITLTAKINTAINDGKTQIEYDEIIYPENLSILESKLYSIESFEVDDNVIYWNETNSNSNEFHSGLDKYNINIKSKT